ncbi:Chemotaxis phosphatase [Oleispira antarctica RB-8]|uniref:Protein phosphatase CheZ n=1 Tax=Oleispira antarctica RB-8 TaxID=698738 RepID=R4YT20_OLEAN|nr:Chemotaxis phosphatase [Oleispira antarctica RB-8]
MAELHMDSQAPSFQQEIKELAEDLLRKIEDGDLGKVVGVVNSINEVRDRTLYDEIGKLTRGLHEAIKNITTGDELSEDSGMGQASDKLSYVIKMTDKAANKTMDLVEEGMPLNSEILDGAADLHEQWQKFLRKELKPNEFRDLTKSIDSYLLQTQINSKKISSNLSGILMAQDFQDLTGQVINRVTKLVTEVETRLVDLVAMAGEVDRITGITHAEPSQNDIPQEDSKKIAPEGPQIDTSLEGVVDGQDDVDDLLSSLGF